MRRSIEPLHHATGLLFCVAMITGAALGLGPVGTAAGATAATGTVAPAATGAKRQVLPLPPEIADLPLVILPAPAGTGGAWFGIFLTGDGGWAALDKTVSADLARQGIPMVGWNSLKYFWSQRTPAGAAQDLDRVMHYYARAWGRAHVLLVGFSQGADTLPFMINRLPSGTRQLIGFVTLLGISDNALFEIHVASLLGKPPRGIPTAPELAQWLGPPYLCMYGQNDKDAACEQLAGRDGEVIKMPGGHHFGGRYAAVAHTIVADLPQTAHSVDVP